MCLTHQKHTKGRFVSLRLTIIRVKHSSVFRQTRIEVSHEGCDVLGGCEHLMDHISGGNEACESRNTQGVTSRSGDVPNKSPVDEFTFPLTSSRHCDFLQHVAIEREPEGKSHSLQITSKKSKVEEKNQTKVVTAAQSAELLSGNHLFNISTL